MGNFKKENFLPILRKLIWGVAIIAPLAIYCIHFRGCKLSSDSEDWGNFGSYVGGLYSILVTVFAIYLTRILGKKDERSRKTADSAEILHKSIVSLKSNPAPSPEDVSSFQKNIESCSIYLQESLKNKLVRLADQYLDKQNNTGEFDFNLENTVMKELKRLYNES